MLALMDEVNNMQELMSNINKKKCYESKDYDENKIHCNINEECWVH